MLSLSKSQYKLLAAIGLWLAFVIAALIYFQLSGLREFDPQWQLHQPHWLKRFKMESDWRPSDQARLMIIIDKECACTRRSENHIQQLNAYALKQNISVAIIERDLASAKLVPNTPAAVLLDKQGELVYAGPLSAGLACSASDGFVELAINNLSAGFNSKLSISDTRGCYCVSK